MSMAGMNNRYCVLTCLYIAVSTSSVVAQPVLDFRPIPPGPKSRTTAGVVHGNRIEVLPGNIVQLDMFVSEWANVVGQTIGIIHVTLDGDSYCTGPGAPLNPLGYPTAPIASCQQGNSCPIDGDTCSEGAYITMRRCTVGAISPPTGDSCTQAADCPGEFCIEDPDYISPLLDVALVGFSIDRKLSYEYSFATTGINVIISDPGFPKYIATLLVEIPMAASGLYSFSVKDNGTLTHWSSGLAGASNAPFGTIILPEILVVVDPIIDVDGNGIDDICDCDCSGVASNLTSCNVPGCGLGINCIQASVPTISNWGAVVFFLSILVGVMIHARRYA